MVMIRAFVVCLLIAAAAALPTLWVDSPGVNSLLSLTAVGFVLIGLFFLAHWLLERVAPTEHVPFRPRHEGVPPVPAPRDRRPRGPAR